MQVLIVKQHTALFLCFSRGIMVVTNHIRKDLAKTKRGRWGGVKYYCGAILSLSLQCALHLKAYNVRTQQTIGDQSNSDCRDQRVRFSCIVCTIYCESTCIMYNIQQSVFQLDAMYSL